MSKNIVPLQDVGMRVSKWNAARYAREHNLDLAVRLLEEELGEFFTSNEEVDRLDGLCDTIYVAFGVIWKCNGQGETIEPYFDRAFQFVDELPNDMLVYAAYAKACITSMQFGASPIQMSANIILLCLAEAMDSLHMTYDEVVQALHVVCDSNDSKKIKRVASDVKANDNDKGDTFIPPEKSLQLILDNRVTKRFH